MGKRSRQQRDARSQRENARRQADAAAKLQQARAFHARGQLAEAQRLYEDLLREHPDHPEATHLLGVVALQGGRIEAAVRLISQAVTLDPNNAQAHANLGSALMSVTRAEEALAQYDRALQLNPQFAGVHHNRGTALQLLGRHAEAARSFEQLLRSMPNADFAPGNLFHSRGHGCDWNELDALRERVVQAVRAGRRSARPFAFLSISPSAAEQLQCARTYAAYEGGPTTAPLWNGECYEHDRIRIAYVSADFRDHIVAHLMAPIYERHDARQFETLGVALAGSDDSPIVARCKRALRQFIDVSGLSDADAAHKLRELEIDIAIDLTGYTQGSRSGIFARRPAPVQVNYLGFPGTMGAPYMDYLLADDFVIPPGMRVHYAEQIAYLPGTFQANDERRTLVGAQSPPTRGEVGLPETEIVYCCFNSSYKINPAVFDMWMRVLKSGSGGVLWLLGDEAAQTHLRQEAVSRGVDARRLIFAPRVPYGAHLARLSLADLFLDTLPFNAGASASDALWAGVPVLTCAGEPLAGRMAGSLLRAVGLPELITYSLDEYERQALALAANPGLLAQYKARLIARRDDAPLFDGASFCRRLEAAYRQMWERVQRGEPPASFAIEQGA